MTIKPITLLAVVNVLFGVCVILNSMWSLNELKIQERLTKSREIQIRHLLSSMGERIDLQIAREKMRDGE